MSNFGTKNIISSQTPPKLQDFTNRIQKNNESLRQYGTALLKLAEKLLPSLPKNQTEDFLRDKFAYGLCAQIDRENAFNKLNKSKSRNEIISFNEFVEYLDSKHDARMKSFQIKYELSDFYRESSIRSDSKIIE